VQDQVPRRKLLLADDSITIQKVVNLTFADEGIDVVAVSDGDEALAKLREDSPDIVLADVNMPGLTGYEICAVIKGRDFADQVPVVLLVGSFEPFDEDEADRVGADGYLTKPFQSISQLVTKVSELLGIDPLDEAQFEDTAEIEPQEPEALNASLESVSVEPATPSFPNPFEGLVSKQEGQEPLIEEPEAESNESGYSDFQDADEFEMSEAFSDDESIEEIEPSETDDARIEEVTEDFLRTQPFTKSDLQEISVDAETGDAAPEEETSTPENSYEANEIESPFTFGATEEEHETVEDTPVFRVESTDEFEPQTQFGSFEDGGDKASVETDSVVEFGSWEPEVTTPESLVPESVAPDIVYPESSVPEISSAPGGVFDSDLPLPEGASVLDLDDVNLLELPPVDNETSEQDVADKQISEEAQGATKDFDFVAESGEDAEITEPQIIEQLETAKDEYIAADIPFEAIDEGPLEEPGPAEDIPSKAMVEAVTRRVIEALSERAIREIAWEVVPDMADLIIKKMAEDKMKD